MSQKNFENKKNEIIDCAAVLFTTKGYEATSVNTILKQMGIAKGTFYYYFESKEEVMDAVIMRVIADELNRIQKILNDNRLSPMEKLLQALFKQPTSVHKENLVDNFYVPDNAFMKQRALQRTLEFVCPLLAKIVEEGNESNDFASNNPLADMQFLVAGIQSIYDFSRIKESKITVEPIAILDSIFHILLIDEGKISKQEILKKITDSW